MEYLRLGTTGLRVSRLCLAWILGKPGATAPIFSATKPEHIDDAIAALELKLDAGDVHRLEELYRAR